MNVMLYFGLCKILGKLWSGFGQRRNFRIWGAFFSTYGRTTESDKADPCYGQDVTMN